MVCPPDGVLELGPQRMMGSVELRMDNVRLRRGRPPLMRKQTTFRSGTDAHRHGPRLVRQSMSLGNRLFSRRTGPRQRDWGKGVRWARGKTRGPINSKARNRYKRKLWTRFGKRRMFVVD